MTALQNIATAISSLGDSPTLFFVLLIVIFALFVLTITVFQLGTRLRHLTYPIYDQVIKDAQKKADLLIKDATEQARAIRTKAEMEAGKILVDRKKEDVVLQKEYAQQLIEVTNQGKDILRKQTELASHMAEEVVKILKSYATSAQIALKTEADSVKEAFKEEKERIHSEFSKLIEETQKDHVVLLAENKRQIAEALAYEIETVRSAIGDYREERFKLVDQQIVELIEATAHIALNKSLSLEEHVDIIRTSLSEAKKQGIFGK